MSAGLALIFAAQLYVQALAPDEVENFSEVLRTAVEHGDNFSRLHGRVKLSLSELSELKAKKDAADKRRLWLIVGGVAVASLAAGGAAAGLYYYIKLNKLSKDLDAAKDAADKEPKAFEERVSKAIEESERLADNCDKIEEENDSQVYHIRKNSCRHDRVINNIDRQLLVDIERYKINKQINELDIQLHQLNKSEYILQGEEYKKSRLLEIDKRKLELELKKFELKVFPDQSFYKLDYILEEENDLEKQRTELESNKVFVTDFHEDFLDEDFLDEDFLDEDFY